MLVFNHWLFFFFNFSTCTIIIICAHFSPHLFTVDKGAFKCVRSLEKQSLLHFLALSTWRSKCRVMHTTTPLEVIIFQCLVEQMIQIWASTQPLCQTTHSNAFFMDYIVNLTLSFGYFNLTNVISGVITTARCTLLVLSVQLSAATWAAPYNTSPQVWSSQIQTINCAIHHILLPG